MLQKSEESTRYSLDRTETKLLASDSKLQIHEGFPWIHKENRTGIHQKNNLTKSFYLLIIVWFVFDDYKTYKYWKKKCLKP